MRSLRVLCAALLLLGFMSAAQAVPCDAPTVVQPHAPTVVQPHAAHHHDGKARPDQALLCKLACAAAMAVLAAPAQSVRAAPGDAVRYALAAPQAPHDAVRAPDPFPPRPSTIA